MGQAVDEAGNVWEVDGAGNPVRIITPASAGGRVFSLPPNPKEVRSEARQDTADARAAAADARAAEAAARAEIEWNATHNPDGSPKSKLGNKPMRQGDADHLEKQINAYSYLKNAIGTFDDKFAGNTVTGGLENFAQRRVSSIGTPGQADWWANFKTIDNMIRNELFGASLTSGEKSAYAETTIDPSMDPAIVKQNLERRAQIAKEVLSRRVQRLHKTFNPEEVEAALGEYKDDLLAGKAEQKADNEVPDPTTGADLKPPPADGPPDLQPQAGGVLAATDGKSRIVRDPRVSAQVDAMINAGAPKAMIDAVLKRQGFPPINAGDLVQAKKWMKDNPGKKYFGSDPTRFEDLNFVQRALANPTVAPIAAGLANYADMATAGTVGALAGEEGRGTLKAASALHPTASTVGQIAGGVTGSLGAEGLVAARAPLAMAKYAPRIADTLYGGLTGFNNAEEGEGLQGAALGAGAGLAGGLIGDKAMRVAGGVARGVRDPAVDLLREAGVPLTVGQIVGQGGMLGRGVKKVEDALTSVPFVGNMIDARRMEGIEGFNQAAFKEAGSPINYTPQSTGAEGMSQLKNAVGDAYEYTLAPVAIDSNSAPFLDDMRGLVDAANKIPNVNGAREAAAAALDSRILGAADPLTGEISGRNFQEAYRGLARTGRERANSDYGHEIGQVMRQGQDALASALEAQNPGAFGAFRAANSTNRNANVLAEALNKAKNSESEFFTPAQLNMADASSTRRLSGSMASAAGDRPFYDLATAGQAVLPSKLPDSGTWTRAIVGGSGIAGLGGVGGYLGGVEGAGTGTGLGLGATLLLAAGGSKPAQKMLVNILASRPDLARQIGGQIADKSGIGGWTGAGTLTPLLVGN